MLKSIICVLFHSGHDFKVIGPYTTQVSDYSPALQFKCRRCGRVFDA
jgi:hypothetical protein